MVHIYLGWKSLLGGLLLTAGAVRVVAARGQDATLPPAPEGWHLPGAVVCRKPVSGHFTSSGSHEFAISCLNEHDGPVIFIAFGPADSQPIAVRVSGVDGLLYRVSRISSSAVSKRDYFWRDEFGPPDHDGLAVQIAAVDGTLYCKSRDCRVWNLGL